MTLRLFIATVKPMDLDDMLPELQTIALEILCTKHPAGVDEMTLMDELDAAGIELFSKQIRHQPESLFRAHFILFHALHRLRPELAAEGMQLDIHCLKIQLRSRRVAAASQTKLDEHDPVAAYYLDPTNLEGMDNAAVERLISDGLRCCLGGPPNRGLDSPHRSEALATLGLEQDADKGEIRQTYRRLAMRYHPDRGGDTATLQRINEAYRLLMAGDSNPSSYC